MIFHCQTAGKTVCPEWIVFGEKSVGLSYGSDIRRRGWDMPDGTPILLTYFISYLKQLKLIKNESKQQS